MAPPLNLTFTVKQSLRHHVLIPQNCPDFADEMHIVAFNTE